MTQGSPQTFRIPQSAFHILLFLSVFTGRVDAQADPSGHWRTLHTEHFRLHFRPANRDVAQVAAREAERAWGLLATELHPPRGAVDLTLADNVDAANGFTTTYPSNRITIYLTPPATDPGLQHYDSWLRLVIVHELAHVFHLDRATGIWGGLQSLFGRAPGLFPNEYQPTWVVEGLATYYESKFTAAGRANGSFHAQILAAASAGGAARSPWDANYFARWPGGLTPYAYGGQFFAAMAQRAGDSVVPRLVDRTAGQLIPFRVGRPLRLAVGRDLGREWPAVTVPAVDTMAGTRGQVIAAGLRHAPAPRVSPDGRRVAYLHDDGRGAARVRVVDASTWRVLRSHRVTGEVSFDWSGDTLLVAQLEFTALRRIRSDLYRWQPDGSWRRLTHGARLTEPRQGSAAIAIDPAANHPVIAGTPLAAPAGVTWGSVVTSPEGRWIAATRHQNGHWSLVRWPAGVPDSMTTVYTTGGVVTDPVWTADGALLAVTEVHGLPQVVRWSDSTSRAVTGDILGARNPAPLADGSLLYATLGARGWELRHAEAMTGSTVGAGETAAAFDSAAAVATRETGYAVWPSLRPHFWIPLYLDAGLAGRFFGASTAGGDAIGRFAYYADALASVDPGRVRGTFVAVTDVLSNPTLDLSYSNDWSPIFFHPTGHAVSEETRDGALGVTFTARRWRRVLSVRVAAETEDRRFVALPDTALATICSGCRDRHLVGGTVSIGAARYVTAPLAISAQDGYAWSVTYRRREEQTTPRWSGEWRSRLALWTRLPLGGGFADPVLALRFAAGRTDGPLVLNFGAGGVSSGTFVLGTGIELGTTREFPVRAYAAGTVRGRRAATATAELRVPAALVGRAVGHLPLGVDKLSFALFGDAGDAWDPGARAQLGRLAAVGVEAIGDLTVNYSFPLRLRLGVAEAIGALPSSGGRRWPQVYAALAADF